jgi:hypothetical protein
MAPPQHQRATAKETGKVEAAPGWVIVLLCVTWSVWSLFSKVLLCTEGMRCMCRQSPQCWRARARTFQRQPVAGLRHDNPTQLQRTRASDIPTGQLLCNASYVPDTV